MLSFRAAHPEAYDVVDLAHIKTKDQVRIDIFAKVLVVGKDEVQGSVGVDFGGDADHVVHGLVLFLEYHGGFGRAEVTHFAVGRGVVLVEVKVAHFLLHRCDNLIPSLLLDLRA